MYVLPDNAHGWIVGISGTVHTTNDGGNTWIEQTSPCTTTLNDDYFHNPNSGFSVGNEGIILSSKDGGITWQKESSTVSDSLLCLCSPHPSYIWSGGSKGTILHSPDSGKTWNKQQSGIQLPIYDIFFLDQENGYAVGGNRSQRLGFVIHTKNSGKIGK